MTKSQSYPLGHVSNITTVNSRNYSALLWNVWNVKIFKFALSTVFRALHQPDSGLHYNSTKVRQGHSKHSSIVDIIYIGSAWLYSRPLIGIPGNHSQECRERKSEWDTLIDHLSKPSKPQVVCSAGTLTTATLLSNRTAPVTDLSNKAAGERGLSIPERSLSTPLTSFQHGRRVLNHSIKITGHIADLSLCQLLETRGQGERSAVAGKTCSWLQMCGEKNLPRNTSGGFSDNKKILALTNKECRGWTSITAFNMQK